MAIGAQQTKIAAVLFPIAEVPLPCPSSFVGLGFARAFDVMNVDRANIIEAALNALSAKRRDQIKLTSPVFRMLVHETAVLIPITLRALRRAKLQFAGLTALAAFAATAPSRRKIASATTIFSAALTEAIGMDLRRFAAVSASDRNGRCSHRICISQYSLKEKPKYFDIACRRISDALKQPDMFIEKPKPPVQQSLI